MSFQNGRQRIGLADVLALALRQPNNLLKINRITNVEVKLVSQHSRKPILAVVYML
jgi:hypothetical protein